ncbi:MAG: hypothetical protein ACI4WW_03360 [Candidatus Coprovivens sp.]
MSSYTGTAENTEGKKKTKAKYTVDSSGFGYSIINESIKNDFDFLINDIPNKLDEFMTYISNACEIDDAFYAENGQSVSDMNEAKLELQKDVVAIKNELSRLHEAFMVDIDEVNAELEYNFGWPIFGHVHGTQVTEDVED